MGDEQDDTIYLKEWRIHADLTQQELGERMGITGTQISRIESGKRDFDGRFLRKFKQVINAAIDEHPHQPGIGQMRIRHLCDALCIKPDAQEWVETFRRHLRVIQAMNVFDDWPKPDDTLPTRHD